MARRRGIGQGDEAVRSHPLGGGSPKPWVGDPQGWGIVLHPRQRALSTITFGGMAGRLPEGDCARLTRGLQPSARPAEPAQVRQPSRCSGHAHRRNQPSPFGVNHWPVHDGSSTQWVVWSCGEYTICQHSPGWATKPGQGSPDLGIAIGRG